MSITRNPPSVRRPRLLSCLAFAAGIGIAPGVLGQAEEPIEVGSTAELLEALVSENAGRTVHLQSGSYELTEPVTIPNGMLLKGSGAMLGQGGLPAGFEPGSESRIVASEGFTGDLLTLGNGVRLSRLHIDYTQGSQGNAVSIGSRKTGDVVAARISNCEIATNAPPAAGPQGPTGRAIAVLSNNPNVGEDPPAHSGSTMRLRLHHSIIRAMAGGNAVTAYNFAPNSRIRVDLTANRLLGAVQLAGGISRPDPVSESQVTMNSRRNLFLGSNNAESGVGWQINGGSSAAIEMGPAETNSNTVRVISVDDRIRGFGVGIYGIAGRRFYLSQGTSSGNLVTMRLLGLQIQTPRLPWAADLFLNAARPEIEWDPFKAGDNNTLRVVMRRSEGSGARANLYTIAGDGPMKEEYEGDNNRLEFVGTAAGFAQTNEGFDPAPPAGFFVP